MIARPKPPLGAWDFAKYHALGNDYIVIDAGLWPSLQPAAVVALCHRQTGIGSDGILAMVPSNKADFGLRIYNPDGGEAEKSGNGLRIFGRFLVDHGYAKTSTFTVETPGGMVQAHVQCDAAEVTKITIAMGKATFTSQAVHMSGPQRDTQTLQLEVAGVYLDVTCVSMGNPHCVVFTPPMDRQRLLALGPQIERHPHFTQRINVQIVHVRDRHNLELLIWERGAGETAASGSSSCAAAAAAFARNLIDNNATLHMPGGTLGIQVADDYSITMTGNATPVFVGHMDVLPA